MPAENFDFLFGTELSALVGLGLLVVVAHYLFLLRKSILAQAPKKDIAAEAGQTRSDRQTVAPRCDRSIYRPEQ
jgi:hypothetical protein